MHDVACMISLVMTGVLYMAYLNGCWHNITVLPRLRPGHWLLLCGMRYQLEQVQCID